MNLTDYNDKYHLAGSVLAIFKDGAFRYFTAGMASVEDQLPLTADTLIRIASISKVIVALGIMKLFEAGKLDFETDVSEYLGFPFRNPHYPDDKITLTMLMTQTSSLNDGQTAGYDLVNGSYEVLRLEDLLLPEGKYYTEKTWLTARPGTQFNYSNFGCGILACIIEKLSGENYDDYLQKVLFGPLGITASFYPYKLTGPIASTYTYQETLRLERTGASFRERAYRPQAPGTNFRGPAGGCFIGLRDLGKILALLLTEQPEIYRPETLRRMKRLHWKGSDPTDSLYDGKGLQLLITNFFPEHTFKGHFGDAYGVASLLLFCEENGTGIIYMTNGGGYHYQKTGIKDLHEELINEAIREFAL